MIDKNILPEGWEVNTLEEIISDSKIGLDRSSKQQNSNGVGVPYIKMNNVNTIGNINLNENIVFVEVSEEERAKYNLLKGDILLNTRNSVELVGKTGIIKDASIPRVFNNNLLRLRFKNFIDSSFINYQINSSAFKNLLLKGKKSTTNICALYQKDLFPLPIIYPPLSEQQEIVAKIEELLSELDQGKQQLETARQQLKVYRQAVLKWAFEGKLTNAIQNQQKTQEGELPEGWKWVQSGELLDFVTSGSRGWAKYYSESGAIFIRITNLDFDSLDLDLQEGTIQYVNPPTNSEGIRTKVQEGDFLFSITGYLGMFAIAPKLENAFVNQHIALCRPKEGFNKKYVGYWIISKSGGIHHLNKMQKGATKAGLGLGDIKNFPVPLCSLEEQNQIVQEIESRLSVCDKVEETITQSVQQAETLRQSILKQAFEGKLVK